MISLHAFELLSGTPQAVPDANLVFTVDVMEHRDERNAGHSAANGAVERYNLADRETRRTTVPTRPAGSRCRGGLQHDEYHAAEQSRQLAFRCFTWVGDRDQYQAAAAPVIQAGWIIGGALRPDPRRGSASTTRWQPLPAEVVVILRHPPVLLPNAFPEYVSSSWSRAWRCACSRGYDILFLTSPLKIVEKRAAVAIAQQQRGQRLSLRAT